MNSKYILLAAITLLVILTSCSSSEESVKEETKQEQVNLVVDYSFFGIENGYDHEIKLAVLSDGKLIGETDPHLLSKSSLSSFKIAKGKHSLKLQVMVNYNGNWEEHSKANDYSIDAVYETESELNSDQTIKLLFDLDKGAIREYN